MKSKLLWVLSVAALFSCGKADNMDWQQVLLPDGYSDSHILSISINGEYIIVGTYGGGALYSDDNCKSWAVFDTSKGLSWDFIMGGYRKGNHIALATLGDGINISNDGGAHWDRFGYNFFGVEYLYAVGYAVAGDLNYMPTADGLVLFGNDINKWRALTEREGFSSQYLYDMAIDDQVLALGSLNGISISQDNGQTWKNFAPNGKVSTDKLPLCKVRAVAVRNGIFYAGCDDGLFVSDNNGNSWEELGQDTLQSAYIRDLVFDHSGRLWIATYKEAACYDPKGKAWQVCLSGDYLPPGGVNCIGVTIEGQILAGTNYGLYKLGSGEAKRFIEQKIDSEFLTTEEPFHQWMLRPISPDYQNCKDQTYLYGSTMGGNFRQHQGNEYNNPEGVPILAVDNGTIVFTDTSIGHSVMRCETPYNGQPLFAHYHHQNEILRKAGDNILRGEPVGTIGKKGNVTNEHLHFEVALSDVGSQIDSVSTTRNSELWVEPLPGCGTIVGVVVDSQDMPVPGARIYGVTKPIPGETPFSFAETYREKVHADSLYGENFVIGDVPAGEYTLYTKVGDSQSRIRVLVEAGKVTRARMKLK